MALVNWTLLCSPQVTKVADAHSSIGQAKLLLHHARRRIRFTSSCSLPEPRLLLRTGGGASRPRPPSPCGRCSSARAGAVRSGLQLLQAGGRPSPLQLQTPSRRCSRRRRQWLVSRGRRRLAAPSKSTTLTLRFILGNPMTQLLNQYNTKIVFGLEL